MRRRGRRVTLGKAALILLTLWALVVILPDLGRVFGNYATLGFEADNDGTISRVTGPPASRPEADIREGDRIDLKRTGLVDRLAVFGGMGGMQYLPLYYGVHLFIEKRRQSHAMTTEVTLRAEPAPLPRAGRLVLLLETACGVMFILLGFVLVWQRPNAMTWGFFLYAMWFNPGQFFVWYAELQRVPYVLLAQEAAQGLAQAAGYAGFIAFALRFPHNVVAPRWRIVERLLPCLAGLLAALQFLAFGAGLGYRTEKFGEAFYLAGYAIDLFVLFLLGMKRRTQVAEDRQRTRWVEWGCWVGLLAFIIADSNEATNLWGPLWGRLSWHPSETQLSVLYLVNAAVPLAIFHAVQRHRVIDVSLALSRATTLFLTWLLIGVGLAAASTYVEEKVPFHDRLVFYIAMVALMKLTAERLHEWLNEACDHLFFGSLVSAEKKMRTLSASLAAGERCDSVDDLLVSEPVSCLRLASAAVFRRDEDGAYRQQAGAVGWRHLPGTSTLALPPRLVKKIEAARKPLRLSSRDLHGDMPAGTASPVLAVPSIGREGMLGVALYGAHKNGTDLTKDEVAMLHEFGHAAVSGYECVQVQRQLQRIEELEEQLRTCNK